MSCFVAESVHLLCCHRARNPCTLHSASERACGYGFFFLPSASPQAERCEHKTLVLLCAAPALGSLIPSTSSHLLIGTKTHNVVENIALQWEFHCDLSAGESGGDAIRENKAQPWVLIL